MNTIDIFGKSKKISLMETNINFLSKPEYITTYSVTEVRVLHFKQMRLHKDKLPKRKLVDLVFSVPLTMVSASGMDILSHITNCEI